MATAAELAGGVSVLETVAEFVPDAVVQEVFGFSRLHLRSLIAAQDPSLPTLVEKGWEALLRDASLVSIPQDLLGVATREEIARELSQILARSPYYVGSAKTTALAHAITANTIVTRASYHQFEAGAISRMSSLMDEAFAEVSGAAELMARRAVALLVKTPESLHGRVLDDVRMSRGDAARFAAEMDGALSRWSGRVAQAVVDDAQSGKRLGFQRAVDTLYHFEDARNPWSKLSQPLSSLELGQILFNHREHVLPIAAGRVLREARGLSADVRARIMGILTKESFLKGQNPARAAARILAGFKAELGPRWGGARVSALRIARTESAYIANEATRVAYEEMGVQWVDVVYTEAAVPCHICPSIAESGPYEIDKVPEGGIPFHPNCRCCYSAAFPRDDARPLREPARVIGAKMWALELARLGFIATTARTLFGVARPSPEDRASVADVVDRLESVETEAAAGEGINRAYEGRLITVRGYRRIEPKTFPLPSSDSFREVRSDNPTRDVYDLRKNQYEIGGLIRGTRILYYKGERGRVEIQPIIDAVGGLKPGDVMFHTHPMAADDGVQSAMPSGGDMRLYLWVSTQIGSATHLIASGEGVHQIVVKVTDRERWDRLIPERWFRIMMAISEETFRGAFWWTTLGIRRFLAWFNAQGLGGTVEVSQPAPPGSPFIPLAPYSPPSRVSPAILSELSRRSAVQLRDLWAAESARQGVSLFRDVDYYRGLLRMVDPQRDWAVAAPTKASALDLLRGQGVALTGTRFSRDEIISHLTGQPVMGRVYLDASRIDYASMLGLPGRSLSVIDLEPVREAAEFASPEDIDRLFGYLVRTAGVPERRNLQVMAAMLESTDPRGDYLMLPSAEMAALASPMIPVGPEPEPFPGVRMPSPEPFDPARWTTAEKRRILSCRPLYGVEWIPDPSIVWWGLWLPGYGDRPPEIGPLLSRSSAVAPPQGEDPWRGGVLYGNRHEWFRDRWGLDLKETDRTTPWDLVTLQAIDYGLHLLPESARGIRSVSRYNPLETQFLRDLGRVIVGGETNLNKILLALADALVLKVLRLGFRDASGSFVGLPDRTPLLRDWIEVEPWRLRDANGAVQHPDTDQGRALAQAGGQWMTPSGAYGEDPADSMVWAIVLYVLGGPLPQEKERFIRTRIFGGDVFQLETVDFGGSLGSLKAPVRSRRGAKVSLA